MHVLIVEDEPKLAQLIERYLEREGYQHTHLANGATVMPWLAHNKTDLVLLDLNLPGCDGLTLCREIRACSHVAIIMTTARVDEIDRLLGLELGADDYICKPYSPREVIARVKAVSRRLQPSSAHRTMDIPPAVLQFDDERLVARIRDVTLSLTLVEYQLLKLLAEHPGRIFSRDQLMDRIYNDQRVVNDRTIDSHIKKIRRKIGMAFPALELVHSVYGAGYKLELPDS